MNTPGDRNAPGEANAPGDANAQGEAHAPSEAHAQGDNIAASESNAQSDADARGDNKRPSAENKARRPPKNLWLLVPVLLPLVGYLGAIGVAEARRAGAPRVEVRIEGYDPRDPVRGHYLQFRLTVESDLAPDPLTPWQIPYDQACLGPVKKGVTSVLGFSGSKPKECTGPLPLSFVQDSHRFYIQQDAAPILEKAVLDGRGTAVILLLKPEKALVHELKVDGKPWTEFAP